MLRLLLAIAAISTGAPFARWAAPAPALAIAALRPAVAAVLQLAAGWRDRAGLRGLGRRERGFVVLGGLMLGVALRDVDRVAAADVDGGLDRAGVYESGVRRAVRPPAWRPGRAPRGRRDRDRVRGQRGARRRRLARGRHGPRSGDGLALVGAVCGAGYFLVGRRLRGAVPLLPYLAAVNGIAAIALIAVSVAVGIPLLALPGHAYVACACAALIASFLGHGLLNAALRTTPTHLVALAVLGEPLCASLLTWAAFGEQPPLHAALGGAIVLVGIGVGFVRRAVTEGLPS